jgi:hypothetical protein
LEASGWKDFALPTRTSPPLLKKLFDIIEKVRQAITSSTNNRSEIQMLTLEQFSQLAAIISAMADVYTIGKESFSEYLARRQKSDRYEEQGKALQEALSTYSDAEVDAIRARIEECRSRFIYEGSGPARKTCLCSVLRDVREGNGGSLPDPEWEKYFNILGC